MRSPLGELWFAAHARHSEAEMRTLGQDVQTRTPGLAAVDELLGAATPAPRSGQPPGGPKVLPGGTIGRVGKAQSSKARRLPTRKFLTAIAARLPLVPAPSGGRSAACRRPRSPPITAEGMRHIPRPVPLVLAARHATASRNAARSSVQPLSRVPPGRYPAARRALDALARADKVMKSRDHQDSK
jgi:hypothetical protein